MKLLQAQFLFSRLVPRLIDRAHALGFEVTWGDAYRDPRVFGNIGEKKGYGHPKSAHKQRLAVDLNLFSDGQYLGTTEAHQMLGEWWEQQHPMARWGGRFRDKKGNPASDGNHYSVEFEGVK